MVEYQIKNRGINDKKVLDAVMKVPRHLFVPDRYINEAYQDYPLPIGKGQTISQPFIVAAMTEALRLKGEERVLEIGTGSGYQAAILAEISKEVFTIEREPLLMEKAKNLLKKMGYKNIHIKIGDGTLGWPEEATFDRIIVTAAAPEIPPPLKEQLAISGIMVIPIGERYNQVLLRVKRKDPEIFDVDELFECAFVPLIGAYGFHSETFDSNSF